METKEFTLPSGKVAIIRMQNGEDDAIISNVRLQQEGKAYNKFVESILLSIDGEKPTEKDIINLRLADKYTIIVMSRIFSLGAILKFEYTWPSTKETVLYEEDLERYIWDYSKPFPKSKEDGGYDKYRIKPIEETEGMDYNFMYFELGGKNFRMRLSDGVFEQNLLKITDDKLNNNEIFKARELAQQLPDGNWAPVGSFRAFTPMEMTKLRAILHTYDDSEPMMVDITNPSNPEETVELPLMSIPDFLAPRVI